VTVIVSDEATAQIAHRDVLQARVESRTDLQSAVVERFLAVLGVENAADLFDEIVDVGHHRTKGTVGGDELFGGGRLFLLGRDVAVPFHLAENVIAAIDGGCEIPARIVVRGRLGQRG